MVKNEPCFAAHSQGKSSLSEDNYFITVSDPIKKF